MEVVLNGTHLGNYYLCEQIKVDKNRVNVAELKETDTEEPAISGGYLGELDTYYDEINKFRSIHKNLPVNFKEPDEDVLNSQQMNWLSRALAFFLWLNGDLENINGLGSVEYKSDIDDFLAKVMIAINDHLDERVIKNAKGKFLLAMERVHRILGADAFRFMPKEYGKRRPINMLLFEVLAYLFTFEEVEKEVTKTVIEEWKVEMDNTGSAFKESVDATPNVVARFGEAENLLELIRIL